VPPVPAARSALAGIRGLAELLTEGNGRSARIFDNLILALIVFSVASIGIEAIPGIPVWCERALHFGEIGVIVVFSLEYVLRIVAAKEKMRFILSFHSLVDLLAIAPFYVVGFDARWLRTLRMLRLLRLLKLQTHLLERTVADRTRELAAKNAELERAQAQIKAELDAARALQIAILPASFPAAAGCDGAARMIPATFMGGDFYDFIELPGGRIGLVMADVSGKGVPAAFFMAVARTNLRDFAIHHNDPGACLAETNDVLCMENPMDLFVSVFYCIFDPLSGLLEYANGGHNHPYLRRADGTIETLDAARGIVLGVMPAAQYPNQQIQLRPGDRLVLYTDGVTEAFNGTEEAYGTERLLSVIRAHGDDDSTALVEHICQSVTTFAGNSPQSDDITLTVLRWNRSPGPELS
jgi:serine phosphatase RsbU (regulator of sigma subunit)